MAISRPWPTLSPAASTWTRATPPAPHRSSRRRRRLDRTPSRSSSSSAQTRMRQTPRATDPFTGRVTAVTSTPSPSSSPPARRSIAAVISPTRRFTWRAPRAATRWRGCCWPSVVASQRLSDHPAGHRDGRDDAGCGEICGAQRGGGACAFASTAGATREGRRGGTSSEGRG